MANLRFNGRIAKKILLNIAASIDIGEPTPVFKAASRLGFVFKALTDLDASENRSYKLRIRKTFETLQKERLIKKEVLLDGSTKLFLLDKGRKKVLHFKFNDLKIKPPVKWDGLWRIVIFDFPQKYKRTRNVFREKIRGLGFHQLQKSVWIHPYPCRDEIDFVGGYLNLCSYIRLIEAKDFDGSKDLYELFF